jgi:hypothetical protein
MFCDRCGARMQSPANFCPVCGRDFTAGPAAPYAVTGGRVMSHVRTLGILWLVYAGLRILQSVALNGFLNRDWWFFDRAPFFVHEVFRGVSAFMLIAGLVGALAGWGLMERRPWARTLAIVLGILVLFNFPIGTALGIFTLWVLMPAQSEMEYRSIQRPD